MSIEWLCAYKCALCGEIVYSGSVTDSDGAHNVARDVITKGTHAGIINYKMPHTCADKSVGICDFIGIKRQEFKNAISVSFGISKEELPPKIYGFRASSIHDILLLLVVYGYVHKDELKRLNIDVGGLNAAFFDFYDLSFYIGDYEGDYIRIISKDTMSEEEVTRYMNKLHEIYGNVF